MWSCLTAWGRTRRCSLLKNIRITRMCCNNVNRAANCDSANLDKTMNAAQKQIEAIRLIEEKGRVLAHAPLAAGNCGKSAWITPICRWKKGGEAFDPPIPARARSITA